MDVLNYNALLKSSQVPLSSTGVILYPQEKSDSTLWASSAIRYGTEAGLFLCRQGQSNLQSASTFFITASMPSTQTQPWRYVNERQISQLGDLYSYVPGSFPTWHDFSKTLGKDLAEFKLENLPLNRPTFVLNSSGLHPLTPLSLLTL